MKHRGEIIKAAIYKSGYSITKLSKNLGRSRNWIYQLFDKNNVSIDIVLAIGDIIHYDFSKDIDILNPENLNNSESIQKGVYNANSNPIDWKSKYLNLLEDYLELLKNINGN